mmetsp:Transcript_526/g.792  ORF Transcript_526/g.792 Transcript_526/m.792 type:complete len:195 (+) Transcript_526:103-687(+)|eukprot:CAMPEP_0194212844 /NCGR_PEP_ID=MMETSP0156-20130528/12968_1 /TAXON_ID=33649 /ORGANISM="Thalassionema nitzschioides, Strain L26-B" /LENGTH=194 /DNA_ID=CAMNT_0038940733 /DNA_START=38 /DNA_END=622 /DNA_ORIENTATION=-
MYGSRSIISLASRYYRFSRNCIKCCQHQQLLANGTIREVSASVHLLSSKENGGQQMDDVSSDSAKKSLAGNAGTIQDGHSNIPGAQSGGKKLAIVFTCKVCETRSAKQFTEQAYQNGVVMVRCPGCENLHLIADRLGFFEDESWDIEKAMERMGEKVKAIGDDNILELTLKDIAGDKITSKDEIIHSEDERKEK